MTLPEIIQNSIDYIEHHLKTELSIAELADMAGYSVYHYSRLFSQATGCPAAEYIQRRRLDHIAAQIAAGHRPTELIMDYGFDTYAGFYKAFLRRYGCAPRKYLHIYQTHNLQKPEVITIYSQDALKTILKNWSLPSSPQIKRIDSATRVWRVDEHHILKAGEKQSLLKEISLAKQLAGQGFTSAQPRLTNLGREYFESEQTFILVHAIDGKPLPAEKRFDTNYAFQYGRSIALLHTALSNMEKDGSIYDETDIFTDVLNWAIPKVKQQNLQWNLGLPANFFTEYEQQDALFHTLPVQLIHRDLNPGNILSDGKHITGFVDFELTERNIRIFDPCYCATGILSETSEPVQNFEKWIDILRAVLKGYDSVSPLTFEEKQAVYYVICSIQLIFSAWLSEQDRLQDLLKTNHAILQSIAGHKDQLMDIF